MVDLEIEPKSIGVAAGDQSTWVTIRVIPNVGKPFVIRLRLRQGRELGKSIIERTDQLGGDSATQKRRPNASDLQRRSNFVANHRRRLLEAAEQAEGIGEVKYAQALRGAASKARQRIEILKGQKPQIGSTRT